MEPKEIIHEVLKEWAVEFVQNRIAAVRKAKLVADGDLISSFRHEVTGALKDVQSVFVAFEGYGRILDMRNRSIDRKRQVPIEDLKEWIQDKGIETFRAGYQRRHGRLPANQQRLLNDIAWGIAKKRFRKRRRRRWYNKGKERDIFILYERLLDALAEEVLEDAKETLKETLVA